MRFHDRRDAGSVTRWAMVHYAAANLAYSPHTQVLSGPHSAIELMPPSLDRLIGSVQVDLSPRRLFLTCRRCHAFPCLPSGSLALSAFADDARHVKPTLDDAKIVSLPGR